ncbi:MAG: hypothetical protein O8C55_00270 [Candidatus Methanoperedens sp.]|nr:hypothetical protein [Candidatus Methanoperedens sp.]
MIDLDQAAPDTDMKITGFSLNIGPVQPATAAHSSLVTCYTAIAANRDNAFIGFCLQKIRRNYCLLSSWYLLSRYHELKNINDHTESFNTMHI